MVGVPARASRAGRSSSAAPPTAPSPTCCRPRGTPAPACTSTAAAPGRCRTGRCGSPSSPTSGCTGWTRAADPGAGDPRAAGAGRRAARRPGGHRPTACSRCGRRTPPAGGAADVVNEIVRIAPDGSTTVLVSGPDFVSDPRLAPDGVSAGLAAVGPPGHALGRRPARRPRRRRHRARARRRAGRVRRAAGLGRRTWRCGGSATGRTSGRCTDASARGGRARPRRGQRHRRAAVGVRAAPLRAAGRRPGRRSPTAAPAPTGSPSWRPTAALRELDLPYAAFRYVTAQGTAVVCVAGGPTAEPVVLRVDVDGGQPEVLRPARDLGLDPAWFSRPEHVTFPTEDARHRHRRGPRAGLPADQPGGLRPRGRAAAADGRRARRADRGAPSPVLNLEVQYWTSRGFCVADVDYRGSTGYGRRYRDALQGRWGVVDLDDVVACARHLADAGRVDPARMAIRGGSAGGYTTLAALTMRPGVFTAGASHFGVADLGALAAETHKFESRYLDGAGGPVARRAPTSTRSAHRSTTSTPSTPRSRSSRARRTRWCRRPRRRRSSRRSGRRACRTPTCCSRASSTASGRRRTSARPWTASCRSTPRSGASTCPPREGIEPIDVVR